MKKKYKSKSRTQIENEIFKPILAVCDNVAEEGKLIWTLPFMRPEGNASAYNYSQKTFYKGISNQLHLGCRMMLEGWEHNAWLTYNGAKALGGYVPHEAKGKGAIVHFNKFVKRDMLDKDGCVVVDSEGNPKVKIIPFLKSFSVFNVAQCKDIPMPKKKKEEKFKPLKALKRAEAIQKAYELQEKNLKVTISDKVVPRYLVTKDEVQCSSMRNHVEVAKKNGQSVNDGKQHYYSSLFHEDGHSAGHKKRLNLLEDDFKFGDHAYSKEELRAEMTSAILCLEAGLNSEVVFNNTKAYCQGWAKRLKNDPKWLMWASSKSLQTANYILGKHNEK